MKLLHIFYKAFLFFNVFGEVLPTTIVAIKFILRTENDELVPSAIIVADRVKVRYYPWIDPYIQEISKLFKAKAFGDPPRHNKYDACAALVTTRENQIKVAKIGEFVVAFGGDDEVRQKFIKITGKVTLVDEKTFHANMLKATTEANVHEATYLYSFRGQLKTFRILPISSVAKVVGIFKKTERHFEAELVTDNLSVMGYGEAQIRQVLAAYTNAGLQIATNDVIMDQLADAFQAAFITQRAGDYFMGQRFTGYVMRFDGISYPVHHVPQNVPKVFDDAFQQRRSIEEVFKKARANIPEEVLGKINFPSTMPGIWKENKQVHAGPSTSSSSRESFNAQYPHRRGTYGDMK